MKHTYIYILVSLLVTLNSNSQTLNDYLTIAAQNDLELQALQYRYQSALEKVTEVGSLPNTTLGVGYFLQEAETRVGAQKAKFSVSQKLPWFGTLAAKEESASFKALAQLNVIDFAKRNLFLGIKKTYYELYELKAKELALNENISILDTYEKLALNELENNKSTMVDVLKIKMERNELSNNLSTVLENLSAKRTIFNLLLNRKETAPIKIIEFISIEDPNELLNRKLINQNPKLLQLDNLKSALIQSELAAKKEGLPVVGIGLDYVFVENRPVESLIDNGKDIVMPMVTLSIPLFSKKYSSKQKQLQLEQKAIETTKDNVTNQFLIVYEKALASLQNSKAAIKTQIENTYQANQAQKVLLTAYQTAKINFEQLLEIQQLKLKFQLKKIASEKEYAIQLATLEFLTTNQ